MQAKKLMPVYWATLLFLVISLAACGGKDAKPEPEPVSDPKLEVRYQRVLVQPVSLSAQFNEDYPDAAAECRIGLIEGLNETKRFQVNKVDADPGKVTDSHTLIVKLNITDMRIISRAARLTWDGFRSSYMDIKMTLTDSKTGKIIREKEFSTHNNVMGASWTFGSTDAYLPRDMGRIIGDYIAAVVP